MRRRHAPSRGRTSIALLGMLTLLVVVAGLPGCADVPPEVTDRFDLPELPGGADQTPSDLLPDPGPVGVAIRLDPMHESGVTADVMAMETQDILVIVIEAMGIAGPGEYPAWLVADGCTPDAEPAILLNPVIGLQDGTGESTTTLEADDVDRTQSLFVRVDGPGSMAIACGHLPSFSPMPSPSLP